MKSNATTAQTYIRWLRDHADAAWDGNFPDEGDVHAAHKLATSLRDVANQMEALLTDLTDAVDNWILPQLSKWGVK